MMSFLVVAFFVLFLRSFCSFTTSFLVDQKAGSSANSNFLGPAWFTILGSKTGVYFGPVFFFLTGPETALGSSDLFLFSFVFGTKPPIYLTD
jgi:hypothetical protein